MINPDILRFIKLAEFRFIIMWTEKTVTIEVDHMIWIVCYPNFSLPCNIRSIFSKLRSMRKSCNINLSNRTTYGASKSFDDLPQLVLEHLEQETLASVQYGAILIDEGHVLEADWFKILVKMLDPDIEYLLLLYDDERLKQLIKINRTNNINFNI